jgi:hypothetical protein
MFIQRLFASQGDLMIMGGSTRGVAVNDELHNVPSIEYVSSFDGQCPCANGK